MHHTLNDIKLIKLSNLWITTVIADKYEYNDIKDDSLISLMSFSVWCIGTAILINLCDVFCKVRGATVWIGSDPSLWAVQFQGHFPMRSNWLVCV